MEQLKDNRPVRLEINLDNLKNNIQEIRRYVGKDTLIMAIVKANAYGHGIITCGRTFLENGADRLGVSILSEGIALRKADINEPILLLNYTPYSQYEELIEYNLIPTIYKYDDAKHLSKVAQSLGKVTKIHLKIETGMNRLGLALDDTTIDDILRITKLDNIEVEGIFTHFACADELDKSHTRLQFERFKELTDRLEDLDVNIPIKYVSNSAAIIELPEYNLDMVRPGIILYGHYPSESVRKDVVNLKPAMALKSYISNIKTIKEGEGVSYGQIFTTSRKSTIATLPIGYADGYSRMLSSKSYVCISDKRAPIVGNICMDQLMVDVTDIESIDLKDEVILFGYGNINYPTVEELALIMGTINYELMCMIGARVPRIYVKEDKYIKFEEYTFD